MKMCVNLLAQLMLYFFSISTINIRIGIYFVYYKYMNRDKKSIANESFIYQTTI